MCDFLHSGIGLFLRASRHFFATGVFLFEVSVSAFLCRVSVDIGKQAEFLDVLSEEASRLRL